MLHVQLDESTGIAVFQPKGALSEGDFSHAVQVIDPYLKAHGGLKGILIYTRSFPGWESFGALVKHLTFIKSCHRKLSHVALVTDSKMGWLVDKIASHFTAAKVKHFSYSDFEQAKDWILQDKPAP